MKTTYRFEYEFKHKDHPNRPLKLLAVDHIAAVNQLKEIYNDISSWTIVNKKRWMKTYRPNKRAKHYRIEGIKTILKYSNNKLYDLDIHDYVKVQDIFNLHQNNQNFRVIEYTTGNDITQRTVLVGQIKSLGG